MRKNHMIRTMKWVAALCLALVTTPVLAQTVEYMHTDALGSVVAVTDAAGNVVERNFYEPYGQDLTGIKDGPGFTGHVSDATTGLSYMQQRYYDPQIGRFLSVDPVTANPNTGMNFNRYWYANSNPYKFVDPDGRYICKAGKSDCAAVRRAIQRLRTSARSATGSNISGRYKAAQVERFYGREGVDNGVTVAADNPNSGRAGTAITANSRTTVHINFSALNAAAKNFPGSTYQDLVESTVVHEGSHGVDQRRRQAAGISPMTSSRAELKQGEVRAYSTEAMFYQGLNQDSPWLLWTRSGGTNHSNINQSAEDSTNGACGTGRCTP